MERPEPITFARLGVRRGLAPHRRAAAREPRRTLRARSSGSDDLDAVHAARRARIPAWFWAAAATTSGSTGSAGRTRPWTCRGRPLGALVDAAARSTTWTPRSRRSRRMRPDEIDGLRGRARTATSRRLTRAELRDGRRSGRGHAVPARASAPGTRVGIYLPMLARDGRGRARARPAAGGVHADLLGLRGAGRRRRACAPSRPRTSSRQTGSCGAARSIPLKRTADEALAEAPAVRAGRWSCGGSAEGSPGADVPMDATPRPLVARGARAAEPDRRRPRPGRRDRPRDAVHGDLHVGHHRRAEGHGPRPRRLPDQDRAGPRAHLRPAGRRLPLLVHRPRLDDGPVGDRRVAAARRAARDLRGRARLPGPGPHLVDRRAPPGDAPRRQRRRSSGR